MRGVKSKWQSGGSIGGWKCRAGDARPSIDKELRAGYRLAAGFAASAALGMVVTRPCVPVACAGTTAGTGVAVDGVNPRALAHFASSLAIVSCFPVGRRGRSRVPGAMRARPCN